MTGTPKTSNPARLPPKTDDLTCNEGQVGDLLSEGESTEVEPAKKGKSGVRVKKPGSSRPS